MTYAPAGGATLLTSNESLKFNVGMFNYLDGIERQAT